MDEAWRLQRGSWSSIEAPVELYDDEGELLDAPAGYSSDTRWFGDQGGFSIEVYSADPEADTRAPSPYLVLVYGMADRVEHVFVEDFPSLLQLLKEMAPVLDLPNWSWDSDEDEDLFGDDDEE